MTALGNEHQIKLFQQVGLCYSRQSEQKNNLKRSEVVRKTVFQSLNMSKHCYGILLFDNLGFRYRQGWRKGLGYEQFIVLKVVLIEEDKLKKHKIYSHQDQLSRCRKDWGVVRETEDGKFENRMMPNEKDLNNFANTVIDIMKAIIKSELEGVFPSLEKCKELLRTQAF